MANGSNIPKPPKKDEKMNRQEWYNDEQYGGLVSAIILTMIVLCILSYAIVESLPPNWIDILLGR